MSSPPRQPVVELVQSAFPPLVAALVSPQAEASCHKNNLNFVEMLQPFCSLPSDAHIRDPSGALLPIRPGLRLTLQYASWEPPAPPVARKWLNEAASLSANLTANIAVDIGGREVQVPSSTPWFDAWRNVFLQVQYPSDHEFLKHYLACIIVVSSEEVDPVASVQSLWSACAASGPNPHQLPKWFFSPALQYHVLLHDASSPTADSSRAEQQFARLKAQFGDAYCALLPINTQAESPTEEFSDPAPDPWAQFIAISPPQEIVSPSQPQGEPPTEEAQEAGEELHPLSPIAPASPAMPSLSSNVASPTPAPSVGSRGRLLSAEDREKLRQLVPEFATKVLLPYAEKQIHTLTELVIARKGLSRSLFSATKRWFGSGSKPGTTASSPQSSPQTPGYGADSAERGLRRLGDLSFLLGLPQLSFPAFHALKRDLAADQAWLMLAGALEMAALSAFLLVDQPPTSPRRAQEYMDEAITTYLNHCRLPQFATRAALLSAEILKSRGLMGEAAQQLIRLTSEDSDLRSALLLEQAAYCFLGMQKPPRLPRKYGFHMVLSGHRFNKAGQRAHALRCYLQALQVYEGRHWGLAEDHILFTVGRQSAFLRQLPDARDAFSKLLCSGSRQSAIQQATFLREFLQTLQGLRETGSSEESLDIMPVPLLDSQGIETLLGSPRTSLVSPSVSGVAATGTTFGQHDSEEAACWEKLEEQLVTEALGNPPLVFKPTLQLFTRLTNNTSKPQAVVNEPVTLQISLNNPLQLPLSLASVRLLWNFSPIGDGPDVNNEFQEHPGVADTQVLPALTLEPGAHQLVTLGMTPHQLGEFTIQAFAFELCGPVMSSDPSGQTSMPGQSALQAPISVPGKILLHVFGPRLKGREENFAADYRLSIVVKSPMPLLQAKFDGMETELLCGETRRLGLWLRNAGPQPLSNLMLVLSPSDAVCLALPLGGKPPPSPLVPLAGQQLQQGHRVGKLVLGNCSGVVRVPLSGGTLAPGQEAAVQLWLRAPLARGSLRMSMLLYYEGQEPSRYRLLRHSWRVSLNNSVQLTAQVLRSASPADPEHHSGETLNLALQVTHTATQDTEDLTDRSLTIQQVALVSQHWNLGPRIIAPPEISLKTHESTHLLFKILRSADSYEGDSRLYSHTSMGSQPQPAAWPGLQFLARDICVAESAATLNGDLKLGVVVRWRVLRGKEISEGQHQVTLTQLGSPVTWPQYGDVPPPPLPAIPEITPELAAAQTLVCHSLRHAPSMQHDFKKTRLCVIPVQLLLQNCSDSPLQVTVNTNDTPSGGVVRSTQLYSPHASASLCFLGPSCRLLALAPRGSASVGLSAALPRPGTYDLARRLSVSCRQSDSKDSTVQAWRSPSPFIITQV